MKKILAICLTLVMVVSLGVTAFAAPGIFISSPSGNLAPELVDYTAESDDCNAKLTITPYADRKNLDDKALAEIEEAYKHIAKRMKNVSFDEVLKEIADKNQLTVSELAVSDLFDISYYNCEVEKHANHDGFKITLKADTVEDLKGIICYDGTTWNNVEILEIKEDGTVTFFAKDLSPFAFVVGGNLPPHTGDSYMVYICLMVLAASALTFIVAAMPKKRRV